MKAWRGTLLAALVLALAAVFFFIVKPATIDVGPVGEPRIFTFEKHELVRVDVSRPDAADIALVETEGHWEIEGTGFEAGRSMVNRVKHQLHDLTARATVVESTDNPELYGLGDNAIHVKLTMRDGSNLEFLAGDPNPQSVSYYIQPLPGEMVFTVKKSAVDYYILTLDEFRERRFAGFDSKDVTRIQAAVRVEGIAPFDLDIESVGDRDWEMHAPLQMAANDDRVRRLLGRVSALKANDFISFEGDEIPAATLAEYGLDKPRVKVDITFGGRDPLGLLVGKDAPSDNRYEELAYMLVEGDTTIYVARRGMLEEFGQDAMEYRNRRVVRMKSVDVVAVDASLAPDKEDDDLFGEAGVRYAAEEWFWKDGVPVPGSTPERVAKTLSELEVDAFVDDHPKKLSTYGMDKPRARVVLTDTAGNERVVLIGGEGDPLVDPEGNERPRRYASIEGSESIYLVDDRSLSVVKDLIREGNRKKKKDEEKAARRERIPSNADPDAQEEEVP